MMNNQPDRSRNRKRRPYVVAKINEIPIGGRLIVDIEGRSIGVFNIQGEFYALRNLCPHQQAPLCEGRIIGTTLPSKPGEYILGREGEILRCPWHAWEFDIKTGYSLFDAKKCRVKNYPVTVESVTPYVESFPVSLSDSEIIVHV